MRQILALIALTILSLVLLQGPLRTQAAPQALPPRPTTEPTATPVPTTTPTPEPAQDNTRAGATIELRAPTMPAGVWTVVQWQDAQGDWHDVEGWQGTLDNGGKRWWVAPADFRTGPFRWIIYENLNGEQLGVSESFALPSSPYEVVVIGIR